MYAIIHLGINNITISKCKNYCNHLREYIYKSRRYLLLFMLFNWNKTFYYGLKRIEKKKLNWIKLDWKRSKKHHFTNKRKDCNKCSYVLYVRQKKMNQIWGSSMAPFVKNICTIVINLEIILLIGIV